MGGPTSFLNALITSQGISGNWTTIRDCRRNLYYMGWIDMVSDYGSERDLLLRDVRVHNESGKCVDKADVMYLSRRQDELSVEALVLFNDVKGRQAQPAESEK